jgi:hypothetical protein
MGVAMHNDIAMQRRMEWWNMFQVKMDTVASKV